MTERIGDAWEHYLSEVYDMEIVDKGPVDLQVTEGIFKGSPVQAKNCCVINSKGYYDNGRAKSSPGVTYMRAHNMEKLANLDLSGFEGLEEDNFSRPGLVHAAVHCPLEDMPKLPKDIPVRTIEHPNQDYEVETAYIGEIVVPAKPLYIDNKDRFGNGERKAWPLRWDELFGVEDKNSNYMDYWTQI